MLKTHTRLIILMTACLAIYSCSEKPGEPKKPKAPDGEVVISYYPSGEILGTVIQEGKKPNIATLTRYEYFKDGKRKKEYNFKDNHYFGKWFYWYHNGNVLASGNFTAKSSDAFNGIGDAVYFWQDGKKMMIIDNRKNRPKDIPEVVYVSSSGDLFTNENVPEYLSAEIRDTLALWASDSSASSP